jgi:hypothetical protein
MVQNFGNAFGGKPPYKGGVVFPHVPAKLIAPARKPAARPQPYSKVFRWRLPDGQTQAPATVEVVGGFTHWQKVPLHRDSAQDAWHVTLHNLQCGRMYHYMLLVDGQPVRDKHCDGLAVPHGQQEEQYQLITDRGPRVLMLFAQTK